MITFTRVENKVKIQVKHGIFCGGGGYFELEIAQNQEYQAELLKLQFQKYMGGQLERIRREAYEQGWKDKSAHRTKEKYFKSSW